MTKVVDDILLFACTAPLSRGDRERGHAHRLISMGNQRDRRKPFDPHAFTAWFAKACDDAGLPTACTFHGLRKAACRRLA